MNADNRTLFCVYLFGEEFCNVLSTHLVSNFRDYWSSDHDMQVPYITNIITGRHFEIISNALRFENNKKMLTRSLVYYDQAFQVRLLNSVEPDVQEEGKQCIRNQNSLSRDNNSV